MNDKSKQLLFILGAPKSGVCLLQNGLQLLGLNTPDSNQDLLQIRQVNADLLKKQGLTLTAVNIFPDRWRDDKTVVDAKQLIIRKFSKCLQNEVPFALGDPLMTRTMPIWLDIFKELKIMPQFIHVLRHPWEVSRSLQESEGLDPVVGQKLWLSYYHDAVTACRGYHNLTIDFEELIADPVAVMQDISAEFELIYPNAAEAQTTDQKLAGFIKPEMRHYYSTGMSCQERHLYKTFERLYLQKAKKNTKKNFTPPIEHQWKAASIASSFHKTIKKLTKPGFYHRELFLKHKEYQSLPDHQDGDSNCIEGRTFWGAPIYLFPSENVSSKLYAFGFVETELTSFFIDYLKYGDVIIDVGAHLGFFSMLAANLVGSRGVVYAFEPTPYTVELLKKNLKPYPQVTVIPRLAWHEMGKVDFQAFDPGHSAFNTAVSSRFSEGQGVNAQMDIIKVDAITLDYFCLERNLQPDLVKIDAESAEMQVLEGMVGLLKKVRPVVTIEVGDLVEQETGSVPLSFDLLCFVQDYDYEPLEVMGNRLQGHQIREERYEYDNIIMVPAERLPRRRPLRGVTLHQGNFT